MQEIQFIQVWAALAIAHTKARRADETGASELATVVIVTAIIAMAHTMGMDVVAEGVETQAQMDFMVNEGCDYIQGYLLSRPVPDEELSGLLRRQA